MTKRFIVDYRAFEPLPEAKQPKFKVRRPVYRKSWEAFDHEPPRVPKPKKVKK